jgi:hypothetical protein
VYFSFSHVSLTANPAFNNETLVAKCKDLNGTTDEHYEQNPAMDIHNHGYPWIYISNKLDIGYIHGYPWIFRIKYFKQSFNCKTH